MLTCRALQSPGRLIQPVHLAELRRYACNDPDTFASMLRIRMYLVPCPKLKELHCEKISQCTCRQGPWNSVSRDEVIVHLSTRLTWPNQLTCPHWWPVSITWNIGLAQGFSLKKFDSIRAACSTAFSSSSTVRDSRHLQSGKGIGLRLWIERAKTTLQNPKRCIRLIHSYLRSNKLTRLNASC